jgi:hypoxanthine phosphoribosyltransferase
MFDANDAQSVLQEADCLYSEEQVLKAIDTTASEIRQRLADLDPLVLCVMTGGIIPAGQLLTRLDFPLQVDYIHATRYQGNTTGGHLNWMVRPSIPIRGRNVLIIDDIYDEGVTLSEIVEYCSEEGAKSIYTAVLVNKLHNRKKGDKPDFICLETEDRYLFGYGMDYHGYLRNMPGIYAIKEN